MVSKAKVVRLTLGGNNLQCGKSVNLPGAATVCDKSKWPTLGWAGTYVVNCGQPVTGGLAFTSPPRLNSDGTISVGHVVSPAGACVYGPWYDQNSGGPGAGPFPDGFGGTFVRQRLWCPGDDMGAEVSIFGEIVFGSQGNGCFGAMPSYGGARSIKLPSGLNDTLYVTARLVSYSHFSTTQTRLGIETATAGPIPLTGGKDICN